ncbi:hypothetical protein [Nocardia vulneris]|uniref:Uncharacterized protein n=1 Tax=Nocardia vulneris TaxID=1141657 RepID=A0ABR4ZCS2_9NOCA|nr:hypothetical protein [Nocardia vulneris]KIA63043.1 hypothetical protein FG87_22050 [Nocardia vulneris]
MTALLHTVTITGTEDNPRIEFACHGTIGAECHSYPDCDCETWDRDHEHPYVQQDECWMKSFFDNAEQGAVDPMPEMLAESDIFVGMSGPITTHFNNEYIEWEFAEVPS